MNPALPQGVPGHSLPQGMGIGGGGLGMGMPMGAQGDLGMGNPMGGQGAGFDLEPRSPVSSKRRIGCARLSVRF